MVERTDNGITRTSGMSTWRAGCGESRSPVRRAGRRNPLDESRAGAPVRPYTEHPTREGKVYCSVVLDVFSRRVVGWSIDSAPTATLVTNALGMAITNRRPEPGALIHSDHGTQ